MLKCFTDLCRVVRPSGAPVCNSRHKLVVMETTLSMGPSCIRLIFNLVDFAALPGWVMPLIN